MHFNTVLPESLLQYIHRHLAEISKATNTQSSEGLLRYLPNPPHLFDGEWIQELPDLIGRHNRQPIRFINIRGYFGHEF